MCNHEKYESIERRLRKQAPWTDFKCNDIHEGDRIIHPDGETGIVIFTKLKNSVNDYPEWHVKYDSTGEYSRLVLQIGKKGIAVVMDESNN
jgi:hypothetical protein